MENVGRRMDRLGGRQRTLRQGVGQAGEDFRAGRPESGNGEDEAG